MHLRIILPEGWVCFGETSPSFIVEGYFLGRSFILDIINPMQYRLQASRCRYSHWKILENTEAVRSEGYGCVSVSLTCTVSKGKIQDTMKRSVLWLSSLSVTCDCPLWLYQVVLRFISCSISCCMWMSTNNWAKDTHDCLLLLSLLQWLAGMLSSSASVICLISKGNSQPLLEKVLEKTHSSRDGPGESTAEQRLYSRYLLTTALPTYTPWWWTS